jgi:tape measure domain-containing protein
MPDGRKVTVSVDIVSGSGNAAKVKAALNPLEQEVKRIHKATQNSAKTTDRVINASTKSRVDHEIRDERRLERERKRQANEFLALMRRTEVESKKATLGMGGVFAGSFLGTMSASAVSSITAKFTEASRAVFNFSASLQQSQVAFSSLMKDSAAAAKHIKDLRDLTQSFPLEFTSISKMSQRLQGAGIEAKKIIPLIKDIGNIAAATGDLGAERMEGLAVALSQIASKGRVSAEEMEQLAERGVPAWRILSETIGKTAAETRKMAEDGEISAEQLFAAFQKFSRMNFGDAMQKQANTFSGAMQQIQNVLLNTAATAFEPLYAKISELATRTARDVVKQKGDLNKIGQVIGQAIGEGIGYGIGAALRQFSIDKAIKGEGAYGAILSGMFGLQRGASAGMLQGVLGGPSASPVIAPAINYARPQDRQFSPLLGTLAGGGESKEVTKIRQEITDLEKLKLTASGKELKTIEAQLAKRQQILKFLDTGVSLAAARAAASGQGGGGGRGADSILNAMRTGTMGQESGGNQYARNARTGASGLFQVMPGNIGPWTKDVFGKAMSQNDFINSPKAQEAVFNHVMGQYLATAMKLAGGNEDVAIRMAAAAWYGGPGAMKRFDDPKRFRANEPSFKEYTSSVLTRTKRGGKDISFGDVQAEVAKNLEGQSNAATKAQQDRITLAFIELYKQTGLIPSKEMVDRIYDIMIEDARRRGIIQPSRADVETQIRQIGEYHAPRRAGELTTDAIVSSDISLIPMLEPPDAIKDKTDAWKEFREEQERIFESTRNFFEDRLRMAMSGDWKSLWRTMLDDLKEQFIRPAADALARLFTGGGSSMGGQGGGLLGGLFGGGGMGPGGTPMFNGGMQFAGAGGYGGSQGGGLLSNLFGGFGGGGGLTTNASVQNTIGLPGGGMFTAGGRGAGGIGGLLRGMGGGSMMAGIGSGLGMAGMLAGSAIGGKWGNFLSMTGMGASIGANFGPWGALIGAGGGALVGLITSLFGGGDKSNKQIKEAALAAYGITLKDKSVINSIKQIGEQYFGKGKAGANATQLMQVDEVKNILRNYAQMSGQNGEKIDLLSHTDPNWSGNQFKSQFGGFRAMGGPVQHGYSYIVGERGPEVFRPHTSGSIDPTVGGSGLSIKMVAALADAIYELKDEVAQFKTMSPDAVVMKGAHGAREALYDAGLQVQSEGGRATERQERVAGRYR